MSVVRVIIASNGQPMPQEYELLYIDVTSEFNRIPSAEICLIDGDIARQHYTICDSDFFEPGRNVEIKLGYEGQAQRPLTVFKGIVIKKRLQIDNSGSVIILELSHEAIKMTGTRKSEVFEKLTDSDIIRRLLRNSGLSTGRITHTTVKHESLVQYYVTDWDFMLSRAEVNGLLIFFEDDLISATAPKISKTGVRHTFEIGSNIYDLEMEADARHQYSSIESRVWDVKKQKLTAPVKATDFKLSQEGIKKGELAKTVAGKKETLISAVRMDEKEAKAWADAKMTRSRLSMIKGRFKVEGNAKVNVGDMIKIEGLGRRFSGETLVTGVRHQVSGKGWQTDIQFGLSADWFSSATDIIDTKAAGLLPGVNGLQIGIVDKYGDDPEKEHRVKVKVPAINDEKGSFVWARLTSLDAGKDRGLFFYPEPGDEVILGFLNDDPRQAIIIGSVYSSAHPPPLKPAAKNPEKGMVTRDGMKVLFDEEKKLLRISTSDKNLITINEKDKTIEIKDANNNSIKLSPDGITLDSGKDVVISSKGNVKIQASGNVEIKGTKIDVT